jgi:dihydrolipoamide dehydrogenase
VSQPNGGTFDIVILGAGSGGYAAALRAAELNLSVALIDKAEWGGTCLHRGCIPTKALLHAAELADQTRESEQFGIKADLVGIDMAGVNSYKDGVVGRLYKGLQGLLKQDKITQFAGHGKLVAKDAVEVDGQRVTGRNIILATGSYSRSIPGLEVDGTRVITSEHALKLDRVPSSAIVLGGGVIGVEFASVWKSFGADVTILEALPRLVAGEDEEISKQVERAFRKRKINFKVGKPFEKVEHTENGVRATIAGGETVEAEVLLVAVGRGPTTKDLGYEQQGVTLDRGFVITNERLHTGVGNIYAVGDIVPGLQLAHRGFAQGIFVAEEIAGLKPAVIDEIGIPRVTYCDPEVASVGYTEAKAKEKFGADQVTSFNYNLGGNGKSQILKTQGFVKVVRQVDGPVLGVHMVGARMGELVGEAQLIYNWEAFPEDVAQLIHAHPTQSEAVGEAFMALAGKPLHAHG